MNSTTVRIAALAAAALLAAPAAFAQASIYPSKPIHIVVTFTTGGAPDIVARLIGSTSDELAAYQRAEITKCAKVVKDSGAKVE